LPEQQGWPGLPHAVQVEPLKPPLVQIVLLAVQVEPWQHCMPEPPQLPQVPLKQVETPVGLGQFAPLAMQAPATQHAPFAQVFPPQQT
jgi:DNA polymerase III psi subunit